MIRDAARWKSAIVGGFLLSAFLVARVDAHRPWFNLEGSPNVEQPYELTDLDVSQVVYAGLATKGRVDYYRMTVGPGFGADVQLVVPAVEACNAFRPSMVIIGPGLPNDDAVPKGVELPRVENGTAMGAVVVDADEWGTFFEPFTQTTYATSERFFRVLDGGDYVIAVIEPDGDAGTYGLALGGSENFGGDPAFLAKIGPVNACQPPELPAATSEADT